PPTPTLFPYTTLFRSRRAHSTHHDESSVAMPCAEQYGHEVAHARPVRRAKALGDESLSLQSIRRQLRGQRSPDFDARDVRGARFHFVSCLDVTGAMLAISRARKRRGSVKF